MPSRKRRRATQPGSLVVPLLGLFVILLSYRFAVDSWDVPGLIAFVMALIAGAAAMNVMVFLGGFVGSLPGRQGTED